MPLALQYLQDSMLCQTIRASHFYQKKQGYCHKKIGYLPKKYHPMHHCINFFLTHQCICFHPLTNPSADSKIPSLPKHMFRNRLVHSASRSRWKNLHFLLMNQCHRLYTYFGKQHLAIPFS